MNDAWQMWRNSCNENDSNPYVSLFPSNKKEFFEIESVKEVFTNTVKLSDVWNHPSSLGYLYMFGITGVAQLAPQFKKGDYIGGLGLFRYFFIPSSHSQLPPKIADCKNEAFVTGMNSASQYMGITGGIGGAVPQIANYAKLGSIGMVIQLGSVVAGGIAGAIESNAVMKKCEETQKENTDDYSHMPNDLSEKCMACHNGDVDNCYETCNRKI